MKGGMIVMEVNRMITYVKLKNFMSFSDVEFNFKKGNTEYKKFVAIYGENGSGKSNFVLSMDFLLKTIRSMDMIGDLEEFRNAYLKKEKKLPDGLLELLTSTFDISKIMEKSRMIGCGDPTGVEYGFILNGHEGYYRLEYGERFQSEKLYYYTGKQRGEIYNINYNDDELEINFSNKLFLTNKIKEEFSNELKKYWGKHTFLSILQKEINEKNEQYIKDGILEYALDVLEMFREIFVGLKNSNGSRSGLGCAKPYNILMDLSEGKIDSKDELVLDKTEKILCDFFTQSYADIKNVFYEKKDVDNKIEYNLIVQKMIAGELRNVNFKNESAGTRQILEIFRSVLGAVCGATVIYDEIDDGIHDLLLKSIIDSVKEEITGQLIITTHNTLLLESIDIKSAYIVNIDYLGNKEVKCLEKYPRIQGSNNPRVMYLKGLFGGVPFCENIDFDEIVSMLNDSKEE